MRSGDLPEYLSPNCHSFIFLVLFCTNFAHFSEIQLECDGRTDGQTDTSSYRDARTHLKKWTQFESLTEKQILPPFGSRGKEEDKDEEGDGGKGKNVREI